MLVQTGMPGQRRGDGEPNPYVLFNGAGFPSCT